MLCKKLLGQIAAAMITVVVCDIRLDSFYGLFRTRNYTSMVKLLSVCFYHYSHPNAYNLIDGIDGLAGFGGLICTFVFGIWFYVIGEIGMASIALDIEVPNALRKGSHIYLQNIITDLLIGMKRFDILVQFIKSCISMGYRPGLITLNPVILDRELIKLDKELLKELIVCFNINAEGFNVFPLYLM